MVQVRNPAKLKVEYLWREVKLQACTFLALC